MCGIIGYVGERDISSILMVSLERLSYRGYDSSGIAIISNSELSHWKCGGKTQVLNNIISNLSIKGELGIGHTRWATHGIPNEINAHPILDENQKFALVHNGIIENFISLKKDLEKRNHIFSSETDSEVIVHLIEENFENSLEEAVLKTVRQLNGNFAFSVISELDPSKIILAKKGSPLIIGCGNNETYFASDINVLLPHTKNIIHLDDEEIAIVRKKSVKILDFNGKNLNKTITVLDWSPKAADKNGYDHYMLKEIFEQPTIIRGILNKYLKDNKLIFKHVDEIKLKLAETRRFIIQACGTSWHAGLIGKYLIEKYAGILTEVDTSSEFRYRHFIASITDIVLAISQSGETADTLACLRAAKSKFLKVISFVNVKNSAMEIESDSVVYSYSGQEIGVASTKNFNAQLTTLCLFSIFLAQIKNNITESVKIAMINSLRKVPDHMQYLLNQHSKIKKIAKKYYKYKNFIFIGRGINYPSALEGSLKLKEISYIHSTAYPAGELKHGPIALIDENMPVVCLCPDTDTYEKMFSNLQEVKSRLGKTIVVCTKGNTEIVDYADDIIFIPKVPQYITPLLISIPLQLLAYEIACLLNCDVDKPRNLAKSVTVE